MKKQWLAAVLAVILIWTCCVSPCFAVATEDAVKQTRATVSQGMKNIVKRAYQMTNIQWTPKADIAGWGNGLTYKKGTTYTGLPYGQPVYADYVPWETSLSEFIDYVNDSSSYMYTKQSTYNKVAPYYSIDCSAFVSWAWGLSSRQTTSTIKNFATQISTSSYTNAEIGDCLCLAGTHAVLITDITYDSSGNINSIEISESTVNATTNYCCQKTRYGVGGSYTLDKLTSKYFGAGYILYRSKTRDSVTYTHCCDVPLAGDSCTSCNIGSSSGGDEDEIYDGIDVSKWQGDINWDTVAQNIDFAIIRCGYGMDMTSQDDPYWKANADACTRLGIPFGVYIYSYADTDEKAVSEAEHVLRLLEGYNPTLPIYLDLEDASILENCSNDDILRHAALFCERIEAAGYTAGIYANYNWWTTYLTSSAYDKWDRWIARYNSYTGYTKDYSMWQYTDSGTVPGISGNVDMNYWYGPLPTTGSNHVHSFTSYVAQQPTCVTEGVKVYQCLTCDYQYTETLLVPGHNWSAQYIAESCTEYASTKYTCTRCGYSYTEYDSDVYSDWSATYPTGIDVSLIESKTQYRYSDYQTTTSSASSLSGWTQVGSDWVKASSGTHQYCHWPEGFDTSHSLYNMYGDWHMSDSETTTTKVVTDISVVTGFIYYHWCRGTYANGPDNRLTSRTKTSTYPAFHAFYSTTPPIELEGPLGDSGYYVFKGQGSCCTDTWRYYDLSVFSQDYTTYTKQYTYGRWSDWSAWSDTAYSESSTRKVETRTVYRYVNTPLEGHSYTNKVTTAATCTGAGVKTYTCSKCSHSYTETIAALGHSYTTKVTAPTCTAQGYTTHTCSRCSDSYKDTYTNATGHSYTSKVTTAATCTMDGVKTYTCSKCSHSYTEAISATGHTAVTDKAVAATCTTDGKTEGSHCSVCNAVIKAQTTIPATGHSYTSKVTTAATCTNAGVKTYTCSKCSHSYTEAIAATGHTPVTDKAVAATCTTDGKTEGSHCSVCNAVIKAQTTVAALGHSYTSAVTAPTCTEQGYTTHTCSRCSDSYKDSYTNATGHNYSYTNMGETHEMVCVACDFSMTEAHSYTNNTCICGAEEILAPIVDENISILHSLNLASDISINYVVKTSLLSGYDSFYLELQVPIYNAGALTGFKTVTIEPVLKGSYYYFTMTDLTAVNMNDMLVATLHMSKGKQEYLSKPDNYSVATYAMVTLNQSNAAHSLKVLCADLLRYGAAAQVYKNYRTDALATMDMTETHKTYFSDLGAVTFGNTNTTYNDLSNPIITWAGKTMNLGSKVVVKFVFNAGVYTGDISKLSLRVLYLGSDGVYHTVTLTNPTVYNEAKRMYAFEFDGLMAAELRTALSVAVYNGDTQLSQTMQYSADTYGNSTSGTLLELCKALFAYSDSAKAYFAK